MSSVGPCSAAGRPVGSRLGGGDREWVCVACGADLVVTFDEAGAGVLPPHEVGAGADMEAPSLAARAAPLDAPQADPLARALARARKTSGALRGQPAIVDAHAEVEPVSVPTS